MRFVVGFFKEKLFGADFEPNQPFSTSWLFEINNTTHWSSFIERKKWYRNVVWPTERCFVLLLDAMPRWLSSSTSNREEEKGDFNLPVMSVWSNDAIITGLWKVFFLNKGRRKTYWNERRPTFREFPVVPCRSVCWEKKKFSYLTTGKTLSLLFWLWWTSLGTL